MKKISIIIIIAVMTAAYPCHVAFSADTETGKISSAGTAESENLKETDLDGKEKKLTSPKTKTLKSTALSMGAEVDSGTVGTGISLSPLLSESFQTDLATGSATVGISIVVPPGRKNIQPNLSLSYSSGNPNGVCGVGWGLATSSIQRSSKKGTPKYDNTDTFVFASGGSAGELVLTAEEADYKEYRQKIETAFMKYAFDNVNLKWTVWDKNGAKYTFGSSVDSRIVNSNATKIFAWFLDSVEDVYGNKIIFTYVKDGSQVYLERAIYTSNDLISPALAADKSVECVYEDGRPDALYSYRSGWKIETNKRLKEVRAKADNVLKWRYMLDYEESIDTGRSLLSQITLFDAEGNSLPPKKFTYQTVE